MKKSKVINIVVLSMLVILILTPLGYAQDFELETRTINEYEALKSLSDMDLDELVIQGYSEDEIYMIENYKDFYTNKIKELKSLDIKTLKLMDYTEEQIKAIKNFDGSEEMLILAASTLTVDSGVVSYSYDSSNNKTNAQVVLSFRWNGQPSWGFTDIFAFVWNADFILNQSSSIMTLEYRNVHYDNKVETTASPELNGLNSACFKFPQNVTASVPGQGVLGHWLRAGGATLNLSQTGRVEQFKIFSAYGYNTVAWSPSYTYPGGLSIKFSLRVIELDNDLADANL
ncbi:hypothetical protein [Alkaliphilus peptidifermentans]|uniref:Uncharacterized protein n=1 Tax=Alkaliphilus peptidifermentans DSM 18978 TaxID=1120976 RepID=A0A1G5L0I9_9FIRM|nr:hypothetical protein [Alkaliphilus peptidifermentans]SCZ05941.1 hypothetical protein SAMN03080606_03914 [Alkaliphilus peptidifermentans DSM 18978]